jgi:nucleotide-binding universal stress UspA family protein
MMKVLLAVDGSDASMTAVATAAALAMPTGTTVEVVSAVPDTFAPEGSVWPNVIRVDPPTDRDRVLDDVARRLSDVAARIRVPGRTVEVRVLEGRPATEIVAEARRFAADLIVMGARGLSTVRRLLVGSVSSEVVDHAPCPVLVARHGTVDRVLWATDGSPDAEHVAAFFEETGLFAQADVRVISVPDAGMPWWTGVAPVDGAVSIEFYADAVEVADRRAAAIADEAARRLGIQGATASPAHPHGDVATTVLAEARAWGADVIAVGARSMGPVRRWLIGSVSREILHHAETSVMIVRPRLATAREHQVEVAATV